MSKELDKVKELLIDENLKFVLIKDDRIIKSNDRGVKPLLDLIRSKEDVRGFSAADKVVGKAAALLYLKLGVREIYARLISKEAVDLFRENGVYYEYTSIQPFIKNRDLTDMCPMDKSVRSISDPDKAFIAISETVRRLMETKTS